MLSTAVAISIAFLALIDPAVAGVICPVKRDGEVALTCAFECCESFEGSEQGYYCCGPEKLKEVEGEEQLAAGRDGIIVTEGDGEQRRQRFIAYGGNNIQIDWSLLIIGLIVSVAISVLCSLLLCLFCNGCWLHRRRNPHMYEEVESGGGAGFTPLCCGFGIPMGTVVFSTHPPQFRSDTDGTDMYSNSSVSGQSQRSRVRFNEDGTPRGVLKNSPGPYV